MLELTLDEVSRARRSCRRRGVARWSLVAAALLLEGCNLANQEKVKGGSIVEIEETSSTLVGEEAALVQDPDGSIRAVLQQEFEVQRVEVTKRRATREVVEASPFDWLFAEVWGDMFFFAFYVLSFGELDEIGDLKIESSPAFLLLPLPGIYFVSEEAGGKSRNRSSTQTVAREPIEPVLRKQDVDSSSLRVSVDGEIVPLVSGRIAMREQVERGLSSGDWPSVSIGYEGRDHEVELPLEMACTSAAALPAWDLPWLRAIDYHGLMYGARSGDRSVVEALGAARSGEGGRWMAQMEQADWEVLTSESMARMSDGALVDFRVPSGLEEKQSAHAMEVASAVVNGTWPELPIRGDFVVQLAVSNPTASDLWQVVVVVDSPGTGVYPVPIGRVPAGGVVRRFIALTARDSLESYPELATHCWMGAQEKRPAPPEIIATTPEVPTADPIPEQAEAKSSKGWEDYLLEADGYASKARAATSRLRKRVAWRAEVTKLERALRTAPAGEVDWIKARIAVVKGQIQAAKKP